MTTSTTVLWVSAHPSSTSLNAQLAQHGQQVLTEGGIEVLTSDLYRLGWDPVLDGDGITGDGRELDPTADVRRAYLEGRLPDDVRREQGAIRPALQPKGNIYATERVQRAARALCARPSSESKHVCGGRRR